MYEKDRIGITISLPEYRYRQVEQAWMFELPSDYEMPIETVMRCRYVAFAVDGRWKSIASIGAWHVKLGTGVHTAELSHFSTNVAKLSCAIVNIGSNKWLVTDQKEALESAMAGYQVVKRPEVTPVCLDLDDAAEAISRRYGVDQSQIEISIHRKPRLRTQTAESGAGTQSE